MRSTSRAVSILPPLLARRSAQLSRFDLSGRFLLHWGLLKAILPLLVVLQPVSRVEAQHFRPHELIVSDPVTGAALLGFDPVAYFLERRAVIGAPESQADFGGKVWYFSSQANREAFVAHPELYVPGFGGHDPVAAAGGVPVSGNPRIHVIRDGRLFLFRTENNRAKFLEEMSIASTAERLWPEVRRGLSP